MRACQYFVLVGAFIFSTAANAQDQCSSYVGQTVTPTTFDATIARFAKLAPKGEFETTVQFETRKAATLSGTTSNLIISMPLHYNDQIVYDADNQKLRIYSAAFSGGGFYPRDDFEAAGVTDKIPANQFGNIDVLVSRTETPIGTYEAQNAYGAKTEVTKIQQTSKGIFDHMTPDFLSADLFKIPERSALTSPERSLKNPYLIGELALTPAEAQTLKPTLKLAFMVTPKEPYLVQGSQHVGETTISNPTDVTDNFSILIADIQCGLVTDATNKVLGAYATN